LGTNVFDTLASFGIARWNERSERAMRPDVDLTWAALNSLVLALGTLITRGRVERQLPEAVSPSSETSSYPTFISPISDHPVASMV
jgi:hypothetical protein